MASNYVSIQLRCYLLYQLGKYVSIPCENSFKYVAIFSINFQLRFWCLWLAKPWHRCDQSLTQKKDRFHVPKPMAPLSFVKWSTKSWVLFWGWNVHIWWPVHRKRIKPMELRRKPDKKTWNSLQNAKRHRIHKRQKGNAATFKYPPSGMIIDDYRWLSRSDNHLGNSYNL